MIELTLPWPPSVNEYWHHNSRGHTYLSRPGRIFRELVVWECKAKRVTRQQGRLAISIRVCAPTHRRLDIDNFAKSALDALQIAGIYQDDSQIDDLRIYRGPVIEAGALHVQIEEIQQKARD